MSDIINLRQVRKQKKRDAKEKQSAVKRVQFGRTKAENVVVELETQRRDKDLDNHKRTKPSGNEGEDT